VLAAQVQHLDRPVDAERRVGDALGAELVGEEGVEAPHPRGDGGGPQEAPVAVLHHEDVVLARRSRRRPGQRVGAAAEALGEVTLLGRQRRDPGARGPREREQAGEIVLAGGPQERRGRVQGP
jgi:hypothetical protein